MQVAPFELRLDAPGTSAVTGSHSSPDPRLARVVCEGEQRDVAPGACLIAALIAERDIREQARASFGAGGASGGSAGDARGADLMTLVDLFRQGAAARFSRGSSGLRP